MARHVAFAVLLVVPFARENPVGGPAFSGPEREYVALAERYLSGDFESAVSELAGWDRRRTARLATAFAGQREQSLRNDRGDRARLDRLVRAAVMLHTEAGARDVEAGDEHLTWARRLVNLLDHPDHEAFLRMWHLYAGVQFQARLRMEDAANHLERALRRFPDDARLLLALGSAYETLASPRAGTTRLPFGHGERVPHARGAAAAVRERLEIAERRFREAIARDPDLAEARLRLGRVLLEQDRPDDALEALSGVETLTVEPLLQHLAWLFTGRAHERAGRIPVAIDFYRAAASACPGCQVPRLALAHALERSGDRAAAVDALQYLLQERRHPASDDPWRLYDFGQRWQQERLLERLRGEVRS
jgi:tetratricopeptide (TPR) repeat protein